ncbi:MAG: GIY-YIG nuclease family protein [Leptolyngbyaceae cyanobacterium RM2_2_4]|nr:GIY-YIG nuclease family protein [Leptolyngbyaceae cyanobacterium RM2_2_4]
MKSYIYKITNKITGQAYIGQTLKTPEKRWREHISPGSNCLFLKSAIVKYGIDSFLIETLLVVEMENKAELIPHMNSLEKEAIQTHGTLAPNGYNLSIGGKNAYRPKRNRNKRRWNLTQETKDKIAKANTGLKRPWMKDHVAKMTESRKRKIICNETGQIWPSIKECADFFKVKPEAVHRHLRGIRKRFRKLTFSYLQQS